MTFYDEDKGEPQAFGAGDIARLGHRQGVRLPRPSWHSLRAALHQSPRNEEEVSHVERAVEAVREDLQVSAQRIEAQTGPKLAAIFEAHEATKRCLGISHCETKFVTKSSAS
jgi:hypothetical protein